MYASPNSEDDVIYLRALCWPSYRKSDKYIIYELANPRLRDGLYSFNVPRTVRFVSETYATSPIIVSSNFTLSASGIIFGSGTGLNFCIFCFNLSTDSRFNLRDVDGRTAWDRYLDAFFPGCLRNGGV